MDLLLLVAFPLVQYPELPSFSCACLSSSRQCKYLQHHLNDPAINDAIRIVAVCLRPTSVDNLTILAGIQPAELRRNGATRSLGRRAVEPGHLFHSALTRPSSADAWRLKSTQPFVSTA